MRLLDIQGVITPDMSKTNIVLSFDVPNGVQGLAIKYEYNPKAVEDENVAGRAIVEGLKKYNVEVANASSFLPVLNFVTLSFNENGTFRGACHRHPNKQEIIISSKGSTFGIQNAPVQAGKWEVVLNCHYIGSNVEYSINIEGIEKV